MRGVGRNWYRWVRTDEANLLVPTTGSQDQTPGHKGRVNAGRHPAGATATGRHFGWKITLSRSANLRSILTPMGSQRPGEHDGMQYDCRQQELTVLATIMWIYFPRRVFERRRKFS
jgi:hypothetical protein